MPVEHEEGCEDQRREDEGAAHYPPQRRRVDLANRPTPLRRRNLRAVPPCAAPLLPLELRAIDLDFLALLVDIDELVLVPALLLAAPSLLARSHTASLAPAQRLRTISPPSTTAFTRSPP